MMYITKQRQVVRSVKGKKRAYGNNRVKKIRFLFKFEKQTKKEMKCGSGHDSLKISNMHFGGNGYQMCKSGKEKDSKRL